MPQIITVGIIVMLFLWVAAKGFGQDRIVQDQISRSEIQDAETEEVLEPIFSEYRRIAIGTSADQVLASIDEKPKFEDEDGYFYVFSEEESAQFVLDADKKVKLISITYSGRDSYAPTYEDVFGKGVAIKTTPEGKIYNLVNYHEAGFWVAYYSSTGDNAMVTITIQKL